RNLEAIDELPCADDDDRPLDGRQVRCFSIEIRRDSSHQLVVIAPDPRPQLAEIRLIGSLITCAFAKVRRDLVGRRAALLPLVESLQDELSRAAPRVSLHRSHREDSRARAPLAPRRSLWRPSARAPVRRYR